jgi:nitrite reductase (NADH) small subunit/3-phenylpropionate/trans-cinnamate dioxygenase ferredoxin subunit
MIHMAWVSLCEIDELAEGRGKYVEIDGFRLGVFLSGGAIFVLDNECPHAGGSLAGGEIEGGCVVCPLHQWSFQLASGELRDTPGVAVRAYKTRLFERPGKAALVQAELPVY